MLNVSMNLSFNMAAENTKVPRMVYEARASTIIFNIINSFPSDGLILLPANVCPIVPLVLLKANRKFEFVDISAETLCMDHDALIQRWTKEDEQPVGLVYVRSYGAVFDASAIFSEIKHLSPDSLIIDDRCLCPPDFEEPLPAHADAVIYSTGYAKYADVGFGGFANLKDDLCYERADLPFDPTHLEQLIDSYKKCLSERAVYTYQDSHWLETKKPELSWESYRDRVEKEVFRVAKIKGDINAIYDAGEFQGFEVKCIHQSWRYNILVKERDKVLEVIRQEGFFASAHYESLAGVFASGNAPVAVDVHGQIINLFNDRYFDVKRAGVLTELLKSLKKNNPGFFK
ncbi:hypothetical protein [Pseudomonas moraviensis]|uniref:Uncharacterized protein (UPF0335 family) n=1 Tax=Pseudomonas moraviensis TaxID=321662 RepID=A0A7Y9VX91_9PSED|nr:hypothetical protein [Pseudomonas moraviensis]NYH10304.1 uncharacterized protein (UPF0335 family) [Pseudomonas moraviensis]